MMNELRFALYAIKKNIANSTELRTSFALTVLGMAINNVSFLVIWIFFIQSVGEINGWRAIDILALDGFVALSYGVVFSFFVGIKQLSQYIADGVFDRFLLSPKNVLLRVVTSTFHASAVGDLVFGVACFGIYAWIVDIHITQLITLFLLTINATVMFFAVSVLIYSAGFYFADAYSVTYSLFDLFMTPTLFHGGLFHGTMRFIFTFLIPSLVIGALPTEILASVSLVHMIALMGITTVWFAGAMWFFHHSVKRYESANFMTFGR
jgi:ABC-2 type transport system permease protein